MLGLSLWAYTSLWHARPNWPGPILHSGMLGLIGLGLYFTLAYWAYQPWPTLHAGALGPLAWAYCLELILHSSALGLSPWAYTLLWHARPITLGLHFTLAC